MAWSIHCWGQERTNKTLPNLARSLDAQEISLKKPVTLHISMLTAGNFFQTRPFRRELVLN